MSALNHSLLWKTNDPAAIKRFYKNGIRNATDHVRRRRWLCSGSACDASGGNVYASAFVDQNLTTQYGFDYPDGTSLYANYVGGDTFAVYNSDGTISMVQVDATAAPNSTVDVSATSSTAQPVVQDQTGCLIAAAALGVVAAGIGQAYGAQIIGNIAARVGSAVGGVIGSIGGPIGTAGGIALGGVGGYATGRFIGQNWGAAAFQTITTTAYALAMCNGHN